MLAAFLPPYPFRIDEPRFLSFYYKLLFEWKDEESIFILGEDYVKPIETYASRPEANFWFSVFFEYDIPSCTKPDNHHYVYLNSHLYDDEIRHNPHQAFRNFMLQRSLGLEKELEDNLAGYINQNKIDAIITPINIASLTKFCQKHNIPLIHIELGPLRKPLYKMTGYFDFTGVNGNTEAEDRYQKWKAEGGKCESTLLELRQFFMDRKLRENVVEKFDIGVPLQVEDDTNLIAYGNGIDNSTILNIVQRQGRKVSVRAHPTSKFALKGKISDKSLDSIDFIQKCKEIYTINSSVGFEALLLGKKTTVLGDSSFKHIHVEDKDFNEKIYHFLFYYLVPLGLWVNPKYIYFRLNYPCEKDIFNFHYKFYLSVQKNNNFIFNNLIIKPKFNLNKITKIKVSIKYYLQLKNNRTILLILQILKKIFV